MRTSGAPSFDETAARCTSQYVAAATGIRIATAQTAIFRTRLRL
jgi:hypothetical protein